MDRLVGGRGLGSLINSLYSVPLLFRVVCLPLIIYFALVVL